MEQRERIGVTKEQAKAYAKAVLEKERGCAVKEIRFIGGGSFGFVYAADTDQPPFTVIMKGFRCDGL